VSISSPGIGSGLDVNSIVSKLMSVESQPLTQMSAQIQTYQAKISALGSLSSALGTFQGSLSSLTTLSTFNSLSATPSNTSVLSAVASSSASAGTYSVNVSQVAQAQRLNSAGYATTTASIGTGISTTVSFQLGGVSGGTFGMTGTKLGSGVLNGGITAGALTIDGTTIATDSSVKSAKLLADAINAQSTTTGVSATAAPTVSSPTLFGSGGTSSFGDVDTSGGGTYALTVGGVQIASQVAGVAGGGSGAVTAASLDSILSGTNSVTTALAQANITFTGSAADGTLQFTDADGSNLTVAENVTGAVTGGTNGAGATNTGTTTTTQSTISLVSANGAQISVGGTNPAVAGLTAGTGGSYTGATFTQDGSQASGSIVIDSTDNTLQGIANAINKGAFGITATIVNDGSTGTPNHLVLTSTATGATSNMKITLSGTSGGDPDSAISSLLAYDPSGTQNLTQSQGAQNTLANVNGIAVSSKSTSITSAITGVALNVTGTGNSSVVVAANSAALSQAVQGFVTAYNTLNTAINQLSVNNATTSTNATQTAASGPLLGDTTTQALQNQLRATLASSITGLSSTAGLNNLTQIGITVDSTAKDGSLALDTGVLGTAINNNFNGIAGLFAAVGSSSDPLISFTSSTANSAPGTYAVNIATLATQGSQIGTTPLAASTTIAANTTWTVTLNDTNPSTAGNTATVTIPPGTYTQTALATMLQSSINGAASFTKAGSSVTASVDANGNLSIVSNQYGSASNILISDGTGSSASALFGGAKPVAGVDVAGTIGGYSAVGKGQTLTGGAGAPVAGLAVKVTGTTTGARGNVGFSQGYAYQLNNLASSYLGSTGQITAETTGINASITATNSQITDFNAHLVTVQANYMAQYTALDTTVADLSSTASFLTQQFAAMAASGA
jgi:flagellar hook-associated protein 2